MIASLVKQAMCRNVKSDVVMRASHSELNLKKKLLQNLLRQGFLILCSDVMMALKTDNHPKSDDINVFEQTAISCLS